MKCKICDDECDNHDLCIGCDLYVEDEIDNLLGYLQSENHCKNYYFKILRTIKTTLEYGSLYKFEYENLIKLWALSEIYEFEYQNPTLAIRIINDLNELKKADDDDDNDDDEIDTRLKYEPKSRCKDGHYVRSRGEKIIDDYLFDNRIFHIYEKLIYDAENDQELKPDFYLPDYNTYIEFWGIDTEWYKEKRQEKENYYNSNNIKFISIEPEHIDNIEDILLKKISKIT